MSSKRDGCWPGVGGHGSRKGKLEGIGGHGSRKGKLLGLVDIETGREALGVDGHRNRKGELQKKDMETGRGSFRKRT